MMALGLETGTPVLLFEISRSPTERRLAGAGLYPNALSRIYMRSCYKSWAAPTE